ASCYFDTNIISFLEIAYTDEKQNFKTKLIPLNNYYSGSKKSGMNSVFYKGYFNMLSLQSLNFDALNKSDNISYINIKNFFLISYRNLLGDNKQLYFNSERKIMTREKGEIMFSLYNKEVKKDFQKLTISELEGLAKKNFIEGII
ncbi:MAG: hypothetical protein WBG30_07305, partial [Psychrilyobacter sp.]|uniref:hypothetical protein n=1 Tax=Psychrilyobacter sp. TaxID=2586924 RepID=UPI003C713810